MMKGPMNSAESFENFKSRITQIFQAEGLSENLLSEIDIWHDKKYEETDRMGGTIENRVIFQMELAEIYIITDRPDLAFDTLSDALVQAYQDGLDDLKLEIEEMIDHI